MFRRFALACALTLFAGRLLAQGLNDNSLNGSYHFVHLLAKVAPPGVTANVYNLSGTIVFSGGGAFTFAGRMGSGANDPVPLTGNGVYSVSPSGYVLLDNPNPNAANVKIDARLGDEGEILVGSSSRATDGSVDFFVALRAPSAAGNSVLSGDYTGGMLGFLNASQAGLASALLTFSSEGGGTIPKVGVFGHAVDVAGDRSFSEEILNVPYTIYTDGTGTAKFGSGFGDGSGLFFGLHNIFVSANGNYVIGSSSDPRVRQIFVAIRNLSGNAGDKDWSGDYWIAETLIETTSPIPAFTSYTGTLRGSIVDGQGTLSESDSGYRVSQETGAGGASFDFSGVEGFRIDANSRGSRGSPGKPEHVNMAVGAAKDGRANAFVGVQVDGFGEREQRHGIFFGVRTPTLRGSGIFVNPLGIVNGASFALPPFPIAPGTSVALFGANLAPAGTDARPQTPAPLPPSLAGVSVLVDGIPAPLYSVKPDQINFQLPFTAKGPTAAIAVSNNGSLSNSVDVKVAPTSPGIYTTSASGIGDGAITHLDFTLVTRQNPAARGEWVSIFLTGLGNVTPAVPAGVAGPSDPLSQVIDRDGVRVLFDRKLAGELQYVGLAPNFVGLYQINVRIPDDASLAGPVSIEIETRNAHSCFATIELAF